MTRTDRVVRHARKLGWLLRTRQMRRVALAATRLRLCQKGLRP